MGTYVHPFVRVGDHSPAEQLGQLADDARLRGLAARTKSPGIRVQAQGYTQSRSSPVVHLLFLRLVCSTAVAFAQQARPGLAEIVPIENYVNTTATSLFVSQDHQKFVTRLSGCG